MQANLPLLLQGGLFIALLLAATIFDIRKRIIPDTICLLIAMTGFILIEPIKLLGILAALPFLLAALFFGGMGGGDIKLMAASGIVLGITGGIAASVLGLTAMLLFMPFILQYKGCEIGNTKNHSLLHPFYPSAV